MTRRCLQVWLVWDATMERRKLGSSVVGLLTVVAASDARLFPFLPPSC